VRVLKTEEMVETKILLWQGSRSIEVVGAMAKQKCRQEKPR
jgi:hypothetical protein